MPFDDVPLDGSYRVYSTSKPPLDQAAAAASQAYGCPMPGYQPGRGWVPNGTLSYADPYQKPGEVGWSLVYDSVTKPHLDPLEIQPIPNTDTVEPPPPPPPPPPDPDPTCP